MERGTSQPRLLQSATRLYPQQNQTTPSFRILPPEEMFKYFPFCNLVFHVVSFSQASPREPIRLSLSAIRQMPRPSHLLGLIIEWGPQTIKLFIMQFSTVSVLKRRLVFFVLTSRRTLLAINKVSVLNASHMNMAPSTITLSVPTGSWCVQFNCTDRYADVCGSTEETDSWCVQFNWRDR